MEANDRDEIQKVFRRIPKWFIRTEQKNSRILISYLRLSNTNEIPIYSSTIEKDCGLDEKSFKHHFNNMRNFSSSIGKVFQTNPDGTIELW